MITINYQVKLIDFWSSKNIESVSKSIYNEIWSYVFESWINQRNSY
jgi:hypothetical protein